MLLLVVLLQTSVQLARPVTSYRALALGGDVADIGYITSSFAILPLLVAVPLGRWLDRWRPGPFLAVAALLLVAAGGILSLADTVLELGVGNAVLGLGNLCLMVPAQALIARRSPDTSHDRDFGVFSAAVGLGQLIGPAIAGLVLSGENLAKDTRTAFLGCVVIAAAALLVSFRLDGPRLVPAAGTTEVVSQPSTMALLRVPGVPAGVLASLTLIAATDLLIGYLPVIGENRGLSPAVVGLLLSIRAATSIVSRLFIKPLVARWSRGGLIATSAAGSAAALLFVTVPSDAVVLGVVLAVVGLLLGIGQPLTMSYVVAAVPTSARGTALALRFAGNRAGQVVIPVAAGAVAAGAGVGAAFWLLSGLLSVSALFVRRGENRRPVP